MTITHPSERGYALDNVFVTTDWLADHINDPDIRVVDTDVPELYAEEHIPVAVNPVDHYYKTSLDDRTHIQVPEVFAQTMQDLGIGDDTLVIAYDRSGGVYSFRLMWALHYHGFTNVRFLDGGLQKWKSEGRKTSNEPVSRSGETHNNKGFTPKVNSEIFASRQRVLDSIDDDNVVLLDVRSDAEWEGLNKRGGARGGRIPGAVHLEWVNFHSNDEIPILKPADEIREMLAGLGVTPDKNVITY